MIQRPTLRQASGAIFIAVRKKFLRFRLDQLWGASQEGFYVVLRQCACYFVVERSYGKSGLQSRLPGSPRWSFQMSGLVTVGHWKW